MDAHVAPMLAPVKLTPIKRSWKLFIKKNSNNTLEMDLKVVVYFLMTRHRVTVQLKQRSSRSAIYNPQELVPGTSRGHDHTIIQHCIHASSKQGNFRGSVGRFALTCYSNSCRTLQRHKVAPEINTARSDY